MIRRIRPLDGNTKRAVFSRGTPRYPLGSPNALGVNQHKGVKVDGKGNGNRKPVPDLEKMPTIGKPMPNRPPPTAPVVGTKPPTNVPSPMQPLPPKVKKPTVPGRGMLHGGPRPMTSLAIAAAKKIKRVG